MTVYHAVDFVIIVIGFILWFIAGYKVGQANEREERVKLYKRFLDDLKRIK
jgi:hypothetical protein